MEKLSILVLIVSLLISFVLLGYTYSYLIMLERKLKYQKSLAEELMNEIATIAEEVKRLKPNTLIVNTITKVMTVTLTRVIVAYRTLTRIITSSVLKPITFTTTKTKVIILNNTVFVTTTSLITHYETIYRTVTLTTSTCPLAFTLRGQDIAIINLTKPVWLELECNGNGTVAFGTYVQYYIIKENKEKWRLLDAQSIIPCSGVWRGITEGTVTILVLRATVTVHTWPLG